MLKNSFLKHKIFLLSIFVLGNTVIVFPKGIGIETAIYSLLLSLIPTLIISYFFVKIGEKPLEFHTAVYSLVALFCILVFLITAKDYIAFVDTVRLPKTPRFIISAVFVLLSFFLGIMKKKVLYLFSLFSFFITALIVVTVFIFSFNNLNFSALKLEEFNLKTLIRQTLTFFIHSFGQLLIPVFFFREYNVRQDKKIYIWGLLLGFCLMLIYVLNIMLVLGSETASAVEYPYATLTSIVSFGRNFSRLDGFTYYVYFYSSLIKCAVCGSVFMSFIKNYKKTAAMCLAAVLLTLCNVQFLDEFLKEDIVNLIILIFEILFPISILITQKIKAHRK